MAVTVAVSRGVHALDALQGCWACYVIVPRFLASMPAAVLINKLTIAEAGAG